MVRARPEKRQATALERKVRFAERQWGAPGGEPFKIALDGWLYQEYWRPLHSFCLAVISKARLCPSCARDAGGLVETYVRPGCHHGESSCEGLRCEPIQFVLLDLPRRSGKTTGTSGFVGAGLFRGEGERFGFISGSEDQSDRLFVEHYARPVLENPTLADRARIVGNKIQVWESRQDKARAAKRGTPLPSCSFEFLSTSISGTTGGKYTVIIIDEARAVSSDIAAALMPSIWDQNGWACPTGAKGHTKTKGDLDDPGHKTLCDTCGAELQPWVGKLLATSSAGELNGGSKDWFFEACDLAEKEPHPRVHVYRAQGVINKSVAESSVAATAGFFGKVESMRDSIEIETSNTAKRRGEDFLTGNEIASVVDSTLTNREAGERPGVAFLDTSTNVELTSLVIVEDDSTLGAEKPWDRVVVSRIDVWDPRNRAQVPAGFIDEHILERYLEEIVPRFKLLRLRIDDRHDGRFRAMVATLRKRPWGRIVMGCTKLVGEDRRLAWTQLEARIKGRTIRIPDHTTLRKELKGARKFYDLDNRMDVREPNRRRRHLDVAESLASCCYDVQELASHSAPSARRGGSAKRLSPLAPSIFKSQFMGKLDPDSLL